MSQRVPLGPEGVIQVRMPVKGEPGGWLPVLGRFIPDTPEGISLHVRKLPGRPVLWVVSEANTGSWFADGSTLAEAVKAARWKIEHVGAEKLRAMTAKVLSLYGAPPALADQ